MGSSRALLLPISIASVFFFSNCADDSPDKECGWVYPSATLHLEPAPESATLLEDGARTPAGDPVVLAACPDPARGGAVPDCRQVHLERLYGPIRILVVAPGYRDARGQVPVQKDCADHREITISLIPAP